MPAPRTFLLVLILMIQSQFSKVCAQHIVEHPIIGPIENNELALSIDRVVFTDTGTNLTFKAKLLAGKELNISTKSYIRIKDDTTKYYVRHAVGVPLGKNIKISDNETFKYRLEFPKSKKQSNYPPAYIDFGEDRPNGVHFYTVYTNDSLLPFPKYLNGNWYNNENGNLDLIIRPDVVIVKSKIYKFISGKRQNGMLTLLDSAKNQQTFYYKQLPDSSCQFGFSEKNHTTYKKDRNVRSRNRSESGNNGPIVKFDTCLIEGFIWGYTKNRKEDVFTIYVNNTLTGNQDIYTTKIRTDGKFSTKIPIYTQNYLIIRSEYGNTSVIMEPGKNLFIMLGDTANYYMGEMANFNEDIDQINNHVKYNFYDAYDKVGKIPSNELKKYIENQAVVAYRRLNSFNNYYQISPKAYAFEKSKIKNDVLEQLLSYELNFNTKYIMKHNRVPDSILPGSIPDSGYYSFLTNSLVNNPKFLFDPGGNICINRIKFLTFLRPRGFVHSVGNIADILKGKHIPYTNEEIKIVNDPSPYELGIQDTTVINKYNRQCQKYVDKYSFEAELYSSRDFRDSVLKTMDIQPGLASDIMMIQDFASRVLNQRSPVNLNVVKRIQHMLHDRSLASFIAELNSNMIAEIKANKHKGGYAIRSNESIPANLIWDSILKQFKGNVLYIDFWETWCAPCRLAIKRFEPVKKDLEGKPVKFIYISSHSSPITAWKNFLPTIHGEHYRLSDEQYKMLQKKFDIVGIPHVVIVDKTGNIVDPYYREFDQKRIKEKIENYL